MCMYVFFHCIWGCDVIKTFWQKVTALISSIISKPIPMTPEICSLGFIPASLSLSCYHTKMIDICLVLARRLAALLEEHRRSMHCSLVKELSHSCHGTVTKSGGRTQVQKRMIYLQKKTKHKAKTHKGENTINGT